MPTPSVVAAKKLYTFYIFSNSDTLISYEERESSTGSGLIRFVGNQCKQKLYMYKFKHLMMTNIKFVNH